MHDPDVVAFDIPRPWPTRIPLATGERQLWWPPIVTIWHREPGGRDSGTICKHGIRWQDETGAWQWKKLNGWKWHAWHWRVQISPLQEVRRRLLTRCANCGGRHTKRHPVNLSRSWYPPKRPWWRGEADLHHHPGDCRGDLHLITREAP
jgi:hypothetical protein